MLRKVLLGFVGLIVLLVAVGFMLPRQSHIERSVVIERPASLIFATVNSFQRFAEWSPWQELDPNMTVSIEGPRSGAGAKYSWKGNDKVGVGVQTIVQATENESVTYDLQFGDGASKSTLLLAPQDGNTRVTWTLDTDMGMNPIGRYFGLMMDSMVGKDFERGMTKLKALVETLPNVDIAGFVVEPAQTPALTVAYLSKSTTSDAAAISKAYAEAYGEIGKFMATNKLLQVGPPLGIDGPMDATTFTFEAAIPVDRADAAAASGVALKQLAAMPALKSTHRGAYEQLSATYAKLDAYAAAHGYATAGGVISSYVDDPANVAADQVRTELYLPVK
jgi:effector-binding domain-containing protein/carbon monoxide dehydrogenase subunit G